MSGYMSSIRNSILSWKQNMEPYEEYLRKKFEKYNHICIFGLGNIGLPTIQTFKEKGLNIDFLCDNDKEKWGREYYGIRCLSLQELKKFKQDTLVIICGRAFKEIYRQLKEEGFSHLDRIFTNKFAIYDYFACHDIACILEKMEEVLETCADEESKRVYTKIIQEWFMKEYTFGNLDEICTDNQYFCQDIFRLEANEIFVDAGAYDGDTLNAFLKVSGGVFEKYYCFELAESNFTSLQDYISQLEEGIRNRIVPINKGLSDQVGQIMYWDSDEGSAICECGNAKGYITTIDKEVHERISYIKMDIEGSELKALAGAKASIKKYTPKLAICLYHKPEDMWEIPLYIKKLVPEYKIYIRHHTDLLNETVCYALI